MTPDHPSIRMSNHDHLAIILKLMEGMQQIQKTLVSGAKGKDDDQAEIVKAGAIELPLAELSAETSNLQDWLTLITPTMADISETSQEWWELVLQEAKAWYDQ